MALLRRMARLFRADLHAVLDRLEEPEALLRESLREMESALTQDEQQQRRMKRELALVDQRLEQIGRSVRDLESQLDLCLASAQETMARALIKRRLQLQQHDRLLTDQRKQLEEASAELDHRLELQRAQLDAIREQASWVVGEREATPEPDWTALDTQIFDADVELALLRAKQQRGLA